MTAIQSTAPEDTREAREEGLTAEDFVDDDPGRVCLTAAEILAAEDVRLHWVPTPEWGVGTGVYVRTPRGCDRNTFEQDQANRKAESKMIDFHERLTVAFACDEDGNRLFSQSDIEALRNKAAAPIFRIGEKVFRLMGWTEQDVSDLVGN